MSVPSEMSMRQIPSAYKIRVRVAYAVAWEALVETHTVEARQFIGEFANRVSPVQALELYFDVVPVPGEMREPVWTRTLSTLDLETLPAQTAFPAITGWKWLRLDLILKLTQYRKSYHEKTVELAQLVGARAAETVTATHVSNAHSVALLLRGVMPVERAVGEYLRGFYLPLATAQTVMQRVQAAVAGEHLAAQYADQEVFELETATQEQPVYPAPDPEPESSPPLPYSPAQ